MHGSDTHAHQHARPEHARPAPRAAGFSLLRLSVAQRLGYVAIALILIWGGVYWALS